MAAKVNTRFVLILSAVLVLLVAAVGAVYLLMFHRTADQLTAEGDSYMYQASTRMDQAQEQDVQAQSAAYTKSGQDYMQAAYAYGQAFEKDSTNVGLLNKYIEALSKVHVDNHINAQRILQEIDQRMRLATELNTADASLLERYYAYQLSQETWMPAEQVHDAIFRHASTKLEIDPNNTVAIKYRGIAEVSRLLENWPVDRIRRAKDDLLLAQQSLPNDPDIPYYLARWNLFEAQRIFAGGVNEDKSQALVDEAKQWMTDLLAAHPDDPKTKLRFIEVMLTRRPDVGGEAQALPVIVELESALSVKPEPMDVVLRLAELLTTIDREVVATASGQGKTTPGIQRAEKLLRAAIAVEPMNVTYLVMLGNALKLQMDLDGALAMYRRADDSQTVGDAVRVLRWQFLQRQARYEIANIELIKAESTTDTAQREEKLQLAEKAVKDLEAVAGRNALVLMLEGKIALLRGRNTEAMVKLDQACDLFLNGGQANVEAMLLSARARQVEQQWGAAAKRLEDVLSRFSFANNAESEIRLRQQLAEIYLQSGQPMQAVPQIERLRQLDPSSLVTGLLHAATLASRQMYDEAFAAYQSLYEQSPGPVRLRYANALAQAGRQEQAVALLREGVEENPKDLALIARLLDMTTDPQQRLALIDQAEQAGLAPESAKTLRLAAQQQTQETRNPEEIIEALGGDGTDVAKLIQQSKMWAQIGQKDKSRESYRKAKALKASDPQVILTGLDYAIADGELDTARQLADQASQLNLDLAGGSFIRGQIAAAEGKIPEAISLIRKGLEERPVHDMGWKLLGDLQLRQNELENAAISYKTAVDQRPNNVPALLGLAETNYRRGRVATAMESMRQAVAYAPNDRGLMERYLAFEASFGDPSRALAERQKQAQQNPGDVANRLMIARLLAESNRADEAIAELDKVVAEHGTSRDTATTRALVYAVAGKPDQGRSALEQYVADRGADADAADFVALGAFLARAGDRDAAVEAFRQGAKREDPKDRPATRVLADFLFDQQQYAQARDLYRSLVDAADLTTADGQRLAMRLTETYLRNNEPDAADQLLAKLPSTPQADLLKAMVARSAGRADEALQLASAAIKADPNNTAAYLQRASLRSAETSPESLASAMGDVDAALRLQPDLPPALRLKSELLIRQNKAPEAIRVLNALLAQQPDDADSRTMLLRLYLSDAKLDEARLVLAEGLQRSPTNPTWLEMDAAMTLQAGNRDEGLAKLARATDTNPTPGNVQALASQYLQFNRPQDALDLLDRQVNLVNANPALQSLRARGLALTGQAEQAGNLLLRAAERARNRAELGFILAQAGLALGDAQAVELFKSLPSPSDRVGLELALAQLEARAGNDQAVLDRLTALLPQVPPDDMMGRQQAVYLQALSAYNLGQMDRAEAAYREVLKNDPDNIGSLNNLAYMLAKDLSRPADALPLAEQAAQLQPQNAQILDTVGLVYLTMGRLSEAQERLEQSIRLQPLPANRLHLAMVYQQLELPDRARQEAEQALKLAETANDLQVREEARRLLEAL